MMTTMSAGAAAGLLVALMVVATTDVRGMELPVAAAPDAGTANPAGAARLLPANSQGTRDLERRVA